jgi:CubicO group peptidase (beta-lactamase class C family)
MPRSARHPARPIPPSLPLGPRVALIALGAVLGVLLPPASGPVAAQAAASQPAGAKPVPLAQPDPLPVRAAQDRIDAYVAERMAAWSVPGLALAVVEDGQVTLTRGYGLADRAQARPMTAQTPVAVGSATKPITATAVMQQVEAGQVELDAPVTRYLPWFQLDDPRSSQITVRQLLSHTAGIPASASLDGRQEPDALERRVRGLEWAQLSGAPGARFEYANDGFNTAGLIVQVVSGTSYEEYVAAKILRPLGMARSTFDPGRAAELGLAQGYVRRKGELVPEKTRFTKAYNPSGMLITTADDAGRYLAAVLSGGALDGARILGERSIAQMWAPAFHVADTLDYGLGWFLSRQEGLDAVVHPGELLTMGSMFVVVPERRLGVAVLANLDNDAKDEIAEGVARLLIGQEPVLREVPRTGPENTFVPNRAVWDRYLGQYETPQGTLTIMRDGDRLVGAITGFSFELEPIADTKFVLHTEISSFDETVVELRPEADGGVSLYVKGQRFGTKR